MAQVIFKRSNYRYDMLKKDIFDMLNALDNGRVSSGMKVLVKPNLLTYAKPKTGITTHPNVVKAVCEYLIEKGASVQVSDSPGMGRFQRVIKETGLADTLAGMPVALKEFSEMVHIEGNTTFPALELARDVFESDMVVNLPKLKSHAVMRLTLGVKNLFGCVVGLEKPKWHYKVGEDRERLAQLLAVIYKSIRPAINILDGIVGLEGNGPGAGGTLRRFDILAGSTDAFSLDIAVCNLLNIPPMSLMTNKAVLDLGFDPAISITGNPEKITNFVFPPPVSVMFGHKIFHKFTRDNLTNRPGCIGENCKQCNECINICPVTAITESRPGVDFDYDKCIRCFCCLEACPHKAINIDVPLLGRIVNGLVRLIG